MITLKVQLVHSEAVLPSKAHDDDTGYDCVATDFGVWDTNRRYIEYDTGVIVELPKGYYCELYPRSSISKTDLILANSVGVVDNSYRGTLRFRFKCVKPLDIYNNNVHSPPYIYKKGDKIGQIVVRKSIECEIQEVVALSDTSRGAGGFGSTGA